MSGEILKSFVVSLGFGVDDASYAKFTKGIASATLRVTALYTAVNTAATGIVYGISKISEGFEEMGYEYKIIAPAINKAIMLRREMLKAYAAAGVNLVEVIQNSVKLNISLTKTRYAFEAIYKSVASRFFTLITKQSDILRAKLYANMPKIQKILERFVQAIFKAFEALTALAIRLWSILTRVYDFFGALDRATNGWSTIILGLVAAWELLNLSFLASPLGIILALGAALLALYDDYMVWKEGGKSLFDWGPVVPVINAVKEALKGVSEVLKAMAEYLSSVIIGLWQLAHGNWSGAFDSLKEAGRSLIAIFERLWTAIQRVTQTIAFGHSSAGEPLELFNNPAVDPKNLRNQNSPLGNFGNWGQTNVHVNQQTTIGVQGAADANATGKAVASEQNRVNAGLSRNLPGAIRPGPK